MKKTLLLMGIVSMFLTLLSFKMYDGPKKAAPGTYQIVIREIKKEFIYTEELLIMIEEKRKDHEEITIPLNEKVQVTIPSRDVINSQGFKPMAEFFYIN